MCWICFETVFCYIYVIETKNRTLEETAALFDGEEATEFVIAHHGAGVTSEKESEKGSDIEHITHLA